MLRASKNVVFWLLISTISASAHPLNRRYDGPSPSLRPTTGIETREFWAGLVPLEAREDQNPMVTPSVPPEDIIHQQGHGVFP